MGRAGSAGNAGSVSQRPRRQTDRERTQGPSDRCHDGGRAEEIRAESRKQREERREKSRSAEDKKQSQGEPGDLGYRRAEAVTAEE